ncbi:MAG TPA: glutathione S-transferase family protein [bacterium]
MSQPQGRLTRSLHSPYARRVQIVLTELGVVYADDLRSSVYEMTDLEAVNPNLKVPVWQDDRETLFESALIIEYLLQRHSPAKGSPGLAPLAPWLRRPDHLWEDGRRLATLESLSDAGFSLRQLQQNGVDLNGAPYLRREQERLQRELDWLESQATREGFVPGWFSIPDVMLVCTLAWAEFRGIYVWRGRPKLEAILALHNKRPSVMATVHRP